MIGVTGSIACGKSSVMRTLAALGAATIDADAVYHELIRPGEPLIAALAARFGSGIIAADGAIDRRALGAIVFSDPAALADLDALTHPAVTAELRRRIASATAPVVAVDAVKLIEGGFAPDCDRLWVVVCDEERQIERLAARNGLDRAEAARRVAAQPPLAGKLALADLVIDNSGSPVATAAQVLGAWASLPIKRPGSGG